MILLLWWYEALLQLMWWLNLFYFIVMQKVPQITAVLVGSCTSAVVVGSCHCSCCEQICCYSCCFVIGCMPHDTSHGSFAALVGSGVVWSECCAQICGYCSRIYSGRCLCPCGKVWWNSLVSPDTAVVKGWNGFSCDMICFGCWCCVSMVLSLPQELWQVLPLHWR